MDKPVNLEVVKQVALGLEPLLDKVVFVGGAVVELYANDPAASALRPTTDIDVVVALKGYANYARLEEQLAKLGFYHDPGSKIICRYLYQQITVDIMPADENILGFSNQWYSKGLNHTVAYKIEKGLQIKLFKPAYFLATKFEAFKGRGGDHRTSHDFEDVVYFLDNRNGWVKEIRKSQGEVKKYLKEEFMHVLKHKSIRQSIGAHLSVQNRKDRLERIVSGMTEIMEN